MVGLVHSNLQARGGHTDGNQGFELGERGQEGIGQRSSEELMDLRTSGDRSSRQEMEDTGSLGVGAQSGCWGPRDCSLEFLETSSDVLEITGSLSVLSKLGS